jgi:hypothetical protein
MSFPSWLLAYRIKQKISDVVRETAMKSSTDSRRAWDSGRHNSSRCESSAATTHHAPIGDCLEAFAAPMTLLSVTLSNTSGARKAPRQFHKPNRAATVLLNKPGQFDSVSQTQVFLSTFIA